MNRSLAILFILIHLAGNTEAGQLFRVPLLLQHFHLHHRQDPSVNFIRFLAMHYAGDDGNKSDDNEDAKLPFHDFDHSSVSVVYSPLVKSVIAILPMDFRDKNKPAEKEENILSRHIGRILQPPRYC
jgi:hypothetical protein